MNSSEAREVVFLYAAEDDHIVGAGFGLSAVAIDDSRLLWDQIWENRGIITEIAHSHPLGPANFSSTDLETAAAVVKALGKSITFTVVHPGGLLRRQFHPAGEAAVEERTLTRDQPWWIDLLWEMSHAFEPRNK